MDFQLIADSLPFLLQGAVLTLQVTAIALVAGTILGTLLALARLSPIKPLAWLATAYIELIRGTPLLVQIFLIYFGLPQITGTNLEPFPAGVLAFSLNSAAYVAEIMRSGIQGVPRGQTEASLSLGFSPRDTMRYIVLPQAFRRVLPPLVNEALNLLKNTSLLSSIALVELTRAGQIVAARSYKPFEMYLAIALVYLAMTMVLSFLSSRLEKRWGEGERR
ncbi:polar amino acid ABC transporter, inner membrane subunit [Deinococcus proteolyticus MRP]|uniref:Polar amino acid ABC transporter, inner membrane subunit n=1 Tax=Deinococcus proteolyticus (strain ATCC 35074 / DSM 20540 / JCM 6276 / NBRC 101906 / NCIMB 13154 / VKM Ac-1939 / CCM 2703 / MRP) TaxID=693977 RepID=F0RMR4_DEIPM|nr:amino acid ABC transporter permease [Deinococcus proteolyticus]ADY27132.1 polar amino acid ABC transporter, inner membrane subunit [Deinococcus proteolyticus MRP]